MTQRRVRPLAERLWEKVRKSNGCWLWVGTTKSNGYGIIGLGRRGEGRAHVHRLSWEWANGPIPPGMAVCHSCDVRNCVRPSHLFLGTQAANLADMHRKGRQADPMVTRHLGESNGRARLTRPQAQAIRERHGSGATTASIAREYGVAETTVRNIVKGRRWLDELPLRGGEI